MFILCGWKIPTTITSYFLSFFCLFTFPWWSILVPCKFFLIIKIRLKYFKCHWEKCVNLAFPQQSQQINNSFFLEQQLNKMEQTSVSWYFKYMLHLISETSLIVFDAKRKSVKVTIWISRYEHEMIFLLLWWICINEKLEACSKTKLNAEIWAYTRSCVQFCMLSFC